MEEDDLMRRISSGRLRGVSRSKAAVAGAADPERQPSRPRVRLQCRSALTGSDDYGNQPAAAAARDRNRTHPPASDGLQQMETGLAANLISEAADASLCRSL